MACILVIGGQISLSQITKDGHHAVLKLLQENWGLCMNSGCGHFFSTLDEINQTNLKMVGSVVLRLNSNELHRSICLLLLM